MDVLSWKIPARNEWFGATPIYENLKICIILHQVPQLAAFSELRDVIMGLPAAEISSLPGFRKASKAGSK